MASSALLLPIEILSKITGFCILPSAIAMLISSKIMLAHLDMFTAFREAAKRKPPGSRRQHLGSPSSSKL
jgi:hypothetical protein